MTDLLETINSLLSGNWNAANTSNRTPKVFGKRHDYKKVDTSLGDHVLSYYYADEQNSVAGFGYHSVDRIRFVVVDVWTSYSDAHSVLMVNEVKRVMAGERKTSATTGCELIEPPMVRDFRDPLRGIYRWVLEFKANKFNEAVVT